MSNRLHRYLIADITVGDIEDFTGSERPLKIITFTVIPSDNFGNTSNVAE